MVLIGISSLIYVLLVPRKMQLSLYGAGVFQSIGYVLLVTTIAALLPGAAVVLVNALVFLVFFTGFLLEQLVYILIGILHFLAVLSLYEVEITLLHLRRIYYRTSMEEVEFDQRLVRMSQRFLRRVKHNWFLRHLPRALDEDALQIIGNLLPDALLEDVMGEDIPRIGFDEIEDSQPEPSRENPVQSTRIQETTPLLQRSLTP